MITLTNSALTTFKTCPKKYEFQYVQGYAPVKDSNALNFGKIIHAALEKLVITKSIEAGEKVIETETSGNEDTFLEPKLLALFQGYARQYSEEKFEVVAAEEQFQFKIKSETTGLPRLDCEMKGVKDRVLKNPQGKLILLETKTTSEEIQDPTAEYWKRLSMDSQISTYFLSAKANGITFEYCIYDVIRKPTIRPKKNETPQEFYERLSDDILANPGFYFARREIPRIEADLIATLNDINLIADAIIYYTERAKFPRHTNACKSVYGTCPFFKVCSKQISINDTEHFQKIENKHRELKEATNDSQKERFSAATNAA